jgi:hypothetical protein
MWNYPIPPEELLCAADQVMRARWPTLQPLFTLRGRQFRCRFVYPGELRVHDANNGDLLARSRAGRPTTPAVVRSARRSAAAPIL